MTRPGERLRAIAQRCCSPRTMERLVDPIVADLQREHAEAIDRGQRWRARWVRCSGCWGLAKAACLHAMTVRGGGGALVNAFAAGILVTGVQVVPSLTLAASYPHLHPDRWPLAQVVLFLLPSALALGVPVGLAVGALSALWNQRATRRGRRLILSIALVCSAAALLNIGWIAPASNQRYRTLVAGRAIPRGINELTIVELRREANAESSRYDTGWGLPAAVSYHMRIALTAAPIVMGLFALSAAAIERQIIRRLFAGVSLTAFVGCYLLFPPRQVALLLPWLSPVAIAWLPNMLMISATLVIVRLRAWSRGVSSHAS